MRNTHTDQDGDEITFWPHKEGQLNEFGKWLRLNFVDGDRIKVYIEQPSNSKALHKKIKNASANDSLTLARSPVILYYYYITIQSIN